MTANGIPADRDTLRELIGAAAAARENSYSPYSHFAVGAALLTRSGKIFSGCNVENSSYGNCCCAERTALFKAVSEGERDFIAVAVVGDTDPAHPATVPCGICLQALSEFAGEDFTVIAAKNTEDYHIYPFGELFPSPFKL